MKKIFSLSAIVLVSFLYTNGAIADTYATTTPGETLNITDDTGKTGAQLKVSASPGVLLAAGTSSGSFVLASMNVNASDDKQLQYGIHNKYSGYYQKPSPEGAADEWIVTPAGSTDTTDLEDPFGDWTKMGGTTGTSGT